MEVNWGGGGFLCLNYRQKSVVITNHSSSQVLFFHSQSCSGNSLPVPSKSILSQYLAKDGTTISAKSMPSRHILVATHGGVIVSLIQTFLVSVQKYLALYGQPAVSMAMGPLNHNI